MEKKEFVEWVRENPESVYKILMPICPDDMGYKCECTNYRGTGPCEQCWHDVIEDYSKLYTNL